MTHTLAAIFETRTDAERARTELIKSGFARDNIQLSDSGSAAGAIPTGSEHSIVDDIKHLFNQLLGREQSDHRVYSEAVSRGHTVLTLETATLDAADRAADIVEAFKPLDLDEHESRWGAGGWAGADMMRSGSAANLQQSGAGAQQSTSQQDVGQQRMPQQSSSQQSTSQQSSSQKAAPPSPQQIKPAAQSDTSRSAQGGAAAESMQRGASGAPLSQGAASDTYRPPAGGDLASSDQFVRRGGMRIYSRDDASRTPNQDSLNILRGEDDGFDSEDSYFHQHWQDTFSYIGGTYQEYDPAYRYGEAMGGSSLHVDRTWNEAEPDLRGTWERTYPQSSWEKFKDAVRAGWDRVTR